MKFGHIHYDDANGGTSYAFFDGHRIEFSPRGSGGYCYAHQSFACIDEVSQERIDDAFAGPVVDDEEGI